VDEGRTELSRRLGTTLPVAGTGQHGMTEVDEPPGCLIAKTLVGSGDERDGHRASLQRGGSRRTAQGAARQVLAGLTSTGRAS